MSMKTRFGVAILVAGTTLTTAADSRTFRSAETKTSVLELFTSEGCSSCPPAERWLSGLKESPRLWKDLVVLSFHVDYWDGLGWKDPLAKPEFTERQRNYSVQWRANSVYTPGFVSDGREWKGWFEQEALPKASRERPGVISATSAGGETWTVSFLPTENVSAERISISGALLGFEMASKVRAGENSGKTLAHDFSVIRFATSRAKQVDKTLEATISLPFSSKLDAKRFAVAFWVATGESQRPIQAVGGWIEK